MTCQQFFHLMPIVLASPVVDEVFFHLFAVRSVAFSQRVLPFA